MPLNSTKLDPDNVAGARVQRRKRITLTVIILNALVIRFLSSAYGLMGTGSRQRSGPLRSLPGHLTRRALDQIPNLSLRLRSTPTVE